MDNSCGGGGRERLAVKKQAFAESAAALPHSLKRSRHYLHSCLNLMKTLSLALQRIDLHSGWDHCRSSYGCRPRLQQRRQLSSVSPYADTVLQHNHSTVSTAQSCGDIAACTASDDNVRGCLTAQYLLEVTVSTDGVLSVITAGAGSSLSLFIQRRAQYRYR